MTDILRYLASHPIHPYLLATAFTVLLTAAYVRRQMEMTNADLVEMVRTMFGVARDFWAHSPVLAVATGLVAVGFAGAFLYFGGEVISELFRILRQQLM